jgi:hypothetical protein
MCLKVISTCFDNRESKHPLSQVRTDRTLPHAEGESISLMLNVSGSCFSSPSLRNLANYQWLMDFALYFILYIIFLFILHIAFVSLYRLLK